MPDLLTLVVTLGIQEAPAIINAIHAAGGTVQNVGPQLDADKVMIAADIATLQAEQAANAAAKPAAT